MHRYLVLLDPIGGGDGLDGLTLQFADPVTNVFVCVGGDEPYVDFWASHADLLAGLPPDYTHPPWTPNGSWCAGIASTPAKRAMRVRGTLGKLEDVVYE
jgi:hypothetical protein